MCDLDPIVPCYVDSGPPTRVAPSSWHPILTWAPQAEKPETVLTKTKSGRVAKTQKPAAKKAAPKKAAPKKAAAKA